MSVGGPSDLRLAVPLVGLAALAVIAAETSIATALAYTAGPLFGYAILRTVLYGPRP